MGIKFAILFVLFVSISVFAQIPDLPTVPVEKLASSTIEISGKLTPKPTHDKLESVLSNLVDLNSTEGVQSAVKYGQQSRVEFKDGKVLVELRLHNNRLAEEIPDLLLKQADAEVYALSKQFIEIWVPIENLVELINSLESVSQAHRPFRAEQTVTTQGFEQAGGNLFHDAEILGEGVRVAIFDNSFARAAEARDEGELPDYIAYNTTGQDFEDNNDPHGTACAEIMYDFAPEAEFYLVKSWGRAQLENAVDYCLAHGVDVISMSKAYWTPDRDYYGGNDRVSKIINDAMENDLLFCSSAGNYTATHYRAEFDSREQGVYHNFGQGENIFVNHFGPDPDNMSNFNAGTTFGVTFAWDDYPRTGIDYDIELVHMGDMGVWEVVAVGNNRQDGDDQPSEAVNFEAERAGNYGIRILNFDGVEGVDFTLFSRHGLGYRIPEGSVTIPGVAEGCFTIGAINYEAWDNDDVAPEDFSSIGPTYDGRIKPDICGMDACLTFTYGENGFWGTSGSTPHVAGAAALVRSQFPEMTALQTKNYMELLAEDVGRRGKDNTFGAGKLFIDPAPEGDPEFNMDLEEAGVVISITQGEKREFDIQIYNNGESALEFTSQIQIFNGPGDGDIDPTHFALFAETSPWDYDLERIFWRDIEDISYRRFRGANAFDEVDLSVYDAIWIGNQQPNAWIAAYNNNLEKFEEWVAAGGAYYMCTGTNNWDVAPIHPGGLIRIEYFSPLGITVLTQDENLLFNFMDWDIGTELVGENLSHTGYSVQDLMRIENSDIFNVMVMGPEEEGIPIVVNYNYGNGYCVVSGTTDGHQHGNPDDFIWGSTGEGMLRYLRSLSNLDDQMNSFDWNPKEAIVNPEDSLCFTITINSSYLEPWDHEADITLFTNDPENNEVRISIIVEVTEANVQQIEVAPQAINSHILIQDNDELEVTVRNTGNHELTWQASLEYENQPNQDEFNVLFAFFQDQPAWGGDLGELVMDEIGNEFRYERFASDQFGDFPIDNFGAIWICHTEQEDEFNFAYNENLERIEEWVDNGGVLYASSGTNNFDPIPVHPGGLYRTGGSSQRGLVVANQNPENPDYNYLADLMNWRTGVRLDGNSLLHTYYEPDDIANIENSNWHQVLVRQDQEKHLPGIIVYRYGRGFCIVAGTTDGHQHQNHREAPHWGSVGDEVCWYMNYLAGKNDWISVWPERGSLLSDESEEIEVYINTENLEDGGHLAVLRFDSNDPDRNVVETSINIRVWDAEDNGREPNHFVDFTESELSHQMLITDIRNEFGEVTGGWEIGLLRSDGNLAGAGVWIPFENLLIYAYGDNPETPDSLEGFSDGEEFSIYVWDLQSDIEQGSEITLEGGSAQWTNGGLSIMSLDLLPPNYIQQDSNIPVKLHLAPAYPNPFNSSVNIKYGLPKASEVDINIFDIKGRFISSLVSGNQVAGKYSTIWSAANVPSGMYVIKLETSGIVLSRKAMLVR